MKRLFAVLVLLLAVACTPFGDGPSYRVLGEATGVEVGSDPVGSATLLVPDATRAEARAAIVDYADEIGPDVELFYVMAVAREDTTTYVCRARWYRNKAAADRYHARPFTPASWPALDMNCPKERPS